MGNERIEIEIVLDDGSLKKGFAKVRKESEVTGSKIKSNIGGAFDSVKSTAIRTAAGIGAAFLGIQGIKKLTNDLINFGTAFAEVSTILPDVTQANEQLRTSLIDTAAQFGTSAEEQAKSFYQIVSAGITDAAAASDVLISANKLAIGGLTTTTGAVDLLTSSINAFGKENISSARAADIIFGTVRLGKTRVEELQTTLGQILPTASALGVSFEETAGAIAQLTTKGLSTSEAVTQLNAVFTAVLKKQEAAKKLGPEVAKAFNLQALQAKGLSKFLEDVRVATGGSEQQLVKLLGRAEGARAILSLGSDGFVGLTEKITELGVESNAADTAFRKVFDTIGKQVDVFKANASAIALKFTSKGEGALFNTLVNINELLNSVVTNFDASLNTLIIKIKSLTLTFAVMFLLIKKEAIAGSFMLLKTRAVSALAEMKVAMKIATESGAVGFAKLRTAIGLTTVGMKGLKIATNLLKASLTLGLTIIIDAVITKFFELQEQTKNTEDAFTALGKSARIFGLEIIRAFQQAFLELMPRVASVFGITNESINETTQKIRGLRSEVTALTTDLEANVPRLSTGLKDVNTTLKAQTEETKAILSDSAKSINDIYTKGITNTISAGIQAIGASLVKGGDAFAQFGKTILNILGDMAIQIGTTLLTTGLGIDALKTSLSLLTGGPAIAAGFALIALGGALKALGGGGASLGAGVGGGGTAPIQETTVADIDEPDVEKDKTQVAIQVEGTVLDPVGVGLQIAEVLQTTFDSTGVSIVEA